MWRAPYVRYEPAGQVAHDHRTDPRAVAPAPRLLRPHRGAARATPPGQRAPAARLAVDDRRMGGAGAASAPRPRSRSPPPPPRCSHASSRTTSRTPSAPPPNSPALGGLRSGRVVADALTRHWWPRRASRSPALRAAALVTPAAATRSTTSPTARACGSAASSTATSTRCCPHARGACSDTPCRERGRTARGRTPHEMGRDRDLAAGRPRGDPVAVEAAGARVRRERRLPGPQRRVHARREHHRARVRGRRRDDGGGRLHARRAAHGT